MKKIAILALDEANGIGINNTLPWKIQDDMNIFRNATMNNIVVMGKHTYYSIQKPLKKRINVVLSKTLFETEKDFYSEDGETCVLFYPDLATFYKDLEAINLKEDKINLFFIGGKTLYESIFDECDEIFLSSIKHVYECDTFINYDFENKFLVDDIKDYPDFTFYKLIKK